MTRPDPAELARTSLRDFLHSEGPDLFEKCERFLAFHADCCRVGMIQVMYRVPVAGALDHRITIDDPFTGRPRELVCYDSNSYLGLHLDPRVREAAHRALDDVGLGTPSAQVLGGTSRYLLELEEEVADLVGRERALVFPSGYQANVAILTGLLREGDAAVLDRFSHASLHDGARYSGATIARYPHLDPATLDAVLGGLEVPGGALVITDSVFSMHGTLAPVPELRQVASRHGARLMLDDAHGLGVLGTTGRGVEEHFDCMGAADVLMGTFSKAPGAAGGYVAGDEALVEYLRYYGRGGLFTASLPAPICAGLTTALRIMRAEPEHRERLWRNARRLHAGLVDAGLRLPALTSPILGVHVGDEDLLLGVAAALFARGIKCGMARYPAVPRGEALLRFTITARHTDEDIDRTVEILARLGQGCGLVQRRVA